MISNSIHITQNLAIYYLEGGIIIRKIMIIFVVMILFLFFNLEKVTCYATEKTSASDETQIQKVRDFNEVAEAKIESLLQQRRELKYCLSYSNELSEKMKYQIALNNIEEELLLLGVTINSKSSENSLLRATVNDLPSFSMFEKTYDITQYNTTRTVNGTQYTVHIVDVSDNGSGNGLIRVTYENDYIVKGKITNLSDSEKLFQSLISFGIDMAVSSLEVPEPASYAISKILGNLVPQSEPYRLLTGTNVCVLEQTIVDEFARFIYVYDTAKQEWAYVACSNYVIQYANFLYTYLGGKEVKSYLWESKTYLNHSQDGTYISAVTQAVNWYIIEKGLGVARITPLDLRMARSIVMFNEGTTNKHIADFPTVTPLEPGMLPIRY